MSPTSVMHMRRTKILFLFSGAANRKKILEEIARGENADTALRGMNHIQGATYIEVPSFLQGLRQLPHLLSFDFIIASDGLPLGWLVMRAARLTRQPTRWVYVALNSSTLMRRHASHGIRRTLLKRFWKSYFRIVCLSREQLEDFVRFGVSRDRLVFLPFGIDTDFYGQVGKVATGEYVLSVGRDLGRDYPTLLEAARYCECPFIIVSSKRRLPEEVLLPSNVEVRYNRPPTEVRSLYERARLVVVPSKASEVPEGSDCSGQTVILDAMAAGRPVIATDRSWIADYFTLGKELVVVPPHEPGALATAITQLWEDNEKAAHVAAAGRAAVQERYTTKKFAAALESKIFTI